MLYVSILVLNIWVESRGHVGTRLPSRKTRSTFGLFIVLRERVLFWSENWLLFFFFKSGKMGSTVPFQDSTNMLVSGCTMSGKTEFVKHLMLNAKELFVTPPSIFIVSYTHWQPCYGEVQKCL